MTVFFHLLGCAPAFTKLIQDSVLNDENVQVLGAGLSGNSPHDRAVVT